MKPFTEFSKNITEAKESKPVHRIQYDERTRQWHHSTNGGFTWKGVSADHARSVNPSRFKDISQRHGMKVVEEVEPIEEMSVAKLKSYAEVARSDYVKKMATDIPKSVKRANHVAKAEHKIIDKTWNEEAAPPTNNVGSGNIAGADENPPADKSKILRRNLRKPSQNA